MNQINVEKIKKTIGIGIRPVEPASYDEILAEARNVPDLRYVLESAVRVIIVLVTLVMVVV